jgi:hypothetical protein
LGGEPEGESAGLPAMMLLGGGCLTSVGDPAGDVDQVEKGGKGLLLLSPATSSIDGFVLTSRRATGSQDHLSEVWVTLKRTRVESYQ